MSCIPTRKKDNEYKSCLKRKKPAEAEWNERQHQWAAQDRKICDRMHIPSKCVRRWRSATETKRALRLAWAFTTALEKLSRRTDRHHHEELFDACRRDAGRVSTYRWRAHVDEPNRTAHGRVHGRAKTKEVENQGCFYRCSRPSRNFQKQTRATKRSEFRKIGDFTSKKR